MSVTTGRITAVEVVRAGAALDGDHATGAMSLDVLYGWDFSEGGGSLSIDGEVYEYTSATFPTDSDEDPTVLVLGSALVADVDDGTFIAVDPEATDKMAHVDTGNGGGPVFARVHQSLVDSIAEGIRPANAQENVHIDDSSGWWVVTDVIGVALTRDPSYLDSTIQLPPGIVPEEGVTQYAQLVVDQAVIDHLQGRVAVVGEIIAARYASGEEGETTPAADSNVIEISSDNGIDVRTPTGETDDEGEPLYDHLLTVPTQARDANGEQIALVLQGNAYLKAASVQALALKGSASDGETTTVSPGARVELGNTIADPSSKPSVSFDARHRRWPGLTSGANEIGWGTHNGFVVQARHNVSGANLLQARFINPDTGLLDHTVDLTNFANVAGFTAGGGYLYVLGKFTGSADWSITRWTPSGTNTAVFANPNISSGSNVALGFDGGQVLLLGLGGTPNIRRYGTGLNLQSTVSISGIGDASRATGVGQTWVALGNEFAWLSGTGSSRTAERANTDSTSSRGWWSYVGRMTGAGQLPSGEFAATNQSGQVAVYNDDRTTSGSLNAAYTDVHTPSGRETRMSPVLPVQWPARTFATISSDAPPPGTNDVRFYASSTSGARTSMWRIPGKPVGQTQATISAAPTSGSNPPQDSGFSSATSGDPGEIVSQAKDGDGEPLMKAPGDGQFRALVGSAGQAGKVTVTIPSAGNPGSRSVTYAVPFAATPVVTVSVAGGSASPGQLNPPLEISNETASGFTVTAGRSGAGTSPIVVNWHAMAATQ